MSLFLQRLILRGIWFREQEHRPEGIGVGMTLWPASIQRAIAVVGCKLCQSRAQLNEIL